MKGIGGDSSRRDFLRVVGMGGGAAALMAVGAKRAAAADPSIVVGFGNAAVGAERIAVAFYSNALGIGSAFGVAGDRAKGTLLNHDHREYFEAARNQEQSHLDVLLGAGLGLDFPYHQFAFPAGTFRSPSAMLAFGESLESIFIGAYLGAIKAASALGDGLGVTLAELAGEILGVECEHRALIRGIAGEDPPNDRFYEGNMGPAPSGVLGDTGSRSTTFALGGDAVNALVALGIQPVS